MTYMNLIYLGVITSRVPIIPMSYRPMSKAPILYHSAMSSMYSDSSTSQAPTL